MARTRLKAIEVAGVRIAVEVPGGTCWDWPERTHAVFASPSDEPDLYIGVRYDLPRWEAEDTIRYSSRGRSFEVGRCAKNGHDWIVKIQGPHGSERIARFDEGLKQGEVALHPSAAAEGVAPLEHPLDEVVFLQAAARRGVVVVDGALRRGADGAFLELREAAKSPTLPGAVLEEAPERVDSGRLALRLTPNGVRAHGTPWGTAALGAEGVALSAIHHVLLSPGSRTRALAREDGFNMLMNHVVAPVHDPAIGENMILAADTISLRLPVLQIAAPQAPAVRSFDWDSPSATRALATPRLG